MLRIIETFNNLPQGYHVDPDANFEPGQIGSLRVRNGNVVVGVSDGLHPEGIIDDIKTEKYRAVRWQEEIVAKVEEFNMKDSYFITAKDIKCQLKEPHVIVKSFISTISVTLVPMNGVVIIPAGTLCNYRSPHNLDLSSEYSNAIRFSCNYAYNIPANYDDSTVMSGRVTIWNKMMIAETNMFDTTAKYNKYSSLYAVNGLLTTNKFSYECKCIGFVLEEPKNTNPMIRFMFDPEGKVQVGGK